MIAAKPSRARALLGFFLDFVEISIIILPLTVPILLLMGLDPIWLAVLISINLQTSGPHWVGAASYLGEEITIYPYINETIISGGTAHEGGAVHVIDTMRVNP